MPWTPRVKLAIDGAAESILKQSGNVQLTSAALTALATGVADKVGTGHTATATGVTVPPGTYSVSNQVEFNNVAARTPTYVKVRAVGSTTTDYLSTVFPAASVTVEGTFTVTVTETTELRPLVQTTQTTAGNRVVKSLGNTRLRVVSVDTMEPVEADSAVAAQINALMDPPSVQARRTSTQGIPTNAITFVQFQAVEHDSMPDGLAQWALGGDVTVRKPGVYLIDATWPWAGSSVGFLRTMYVYKNGSAAGDIIAIDVRPASGGDTINNVIIKKRLAAGDTLRIAVFQDTGAVSNSGILYGTYALLGFTYLRP